MCLVAALAITAGCGGAREPEAPPNVVLIVIDTLRADHVGFMGYPRDTTPALDALAERSVVFTGAVSTSSWTRPAVASLFTSRLPSEHGAVAFDRALAPGEPVLAEVFAGAGYLTAGVSGNFVHVNEATGLARGFAAWKTLSVPIAPGEAGAFWRAGDGDDGPAFRAPTAKEVNAALLALLPEATGRPVFAYVHYMEPHSDYAPPADLRARFERSPTPRWQGRAVTSDELIALASGRSVASEAERAHAIDLYDAEVAAADAGVAELLAALESRGWMERAVVAITSDHGEAFGEHGRWFHALNLHREQLAVPLLVYDSRRDGSGETRDLAVDLTDVAPTLLERAGLSPSPRMRGRALLAGGAVAPRELVAELHADPAFEAHVGPRSQRLALLRHPWKLIVARDGGATAYRVDEDPDEAQPVPVGAGWPAALADSARALRRALDRSAARTGTAQALDPEDLAALRALGYADPRGETTRPAPAE